MVGPCSAPVPAFARYQVTTDGDSGVVNDMNLWGREQGGPRCISDLVKHIVAVSLGAIAIVQGLPELREAE